MNNHIPTPNRSGGFGLIEVLMVIAILGVLAYFAIPAYQDYQTRSRVVEGLEFADAAREPVEEALAEGQKPPADLLGSGGGRVDLLTGLPWTATTDGGYMLAEMDLPRFGNVAAFALELQEQGGTHAWHCRNASKYTKGVALGDAYLPSSCRGAGSQHAVAANLTNQPPAVAGGAPGGTPGGTGGAAGSKTGSTNVAKKAGPPPPSPPTGAATTAYKMPTKDDHPCKDGEVFIPDPRQNLEPVPKHKENAFPNPVTGTCEPDSVNRKDPYKPVKCQVCSGSPVICERLHHEETCEWPNNICINELVNHDTGARELVRKCGHRQEAVSGWVNDASKNDRCTNFDPKFVQTLDFKCTFACTGDNCNQDPNMTGDGDAAMYNPPKP